MSYSPSKLVFDHIKVGDSIQTEYLCNVCKNPLLDAEMATPCGHTFCGFCVGVFKTTSGAITCEMCRQPVVTFVKNHLANTMLRMVDGECNWCKKTIALNTAKDHLQTCEEVVLKCKECQTALKRRHLETHKATCEMVDVQCDCGVAFKRKDEKNHMERTCNLFEVPCPLKCGENIKRYLIPSHVMNCGKAVTVCPVKGCEKSIRQAEKEAHQRTEQVKHFSLIRKEHQNLLWNVLQKVPQNIEAKPSGMITAFNWTLPVAKPSTVIRSPTFNKWERQWCIIVDTNRCTYLHYSRGVDPIRLSVSCIMGTDDDKSVMHSIPLVQLTEGKMARLTKQLPQNATWVAVRMEELQPEIVNVKD